MEEKLDLSAIKALTREKRQYFAAEIRKDPELYNAVNGIGGLSETAQHGELQGTITEKGVKIPNVQVIAINKERVEVKAVSNQYGYYKMNLNEGPYTVTILKDGIKAGMEVEIFNGRVAIINYDLEKAKEMAAMAEQQTVTEPVVEPVTETTTETTTEPTGTEPIA